MSKESDRQMFNAAVEKAKTDIVNGHVKSAPLTPEQQCLERAKLRQGEAARRFALVLQQRTSRPTFNECVDEVFSILRQEFNDWDKDALVTLACMMMAIHAAQALQEAEII